MTINSLCDDAIEAVVDRITDAVDGDTAEYVQDLIHEEVDGVVCNVGVFIGVVFEFVNAHVQEWFGESFGYDIERTDELTIDDDGTLTTKEE